MPSLEEYVEEIKDMWDTHWLTNMGPKHKKFQEELKQYLGVENIDLMTNGHMALELSLQALNLSGEVITTPFTFASTTHAIVRNGLEPVFCDIDPNDFNIEEIDRIAKKYGLKVIYDAAHTFGETYKGKGIGSYGDVSCFSFHATKVFNSIEGGAVCFGNELKDFGLDLYRLKNFGIRGTEVVDAVGANAKMNEFCAAMGICNLRHVDEEINKRRIVVERYRSHLDGVEGIQLSPIQKDVKPNYAYFPVVFDDKVFGATRNEVFDKLAENEIGARKYFYPLALEDVDRICEIVLKCRG